VCMKKNYTVRESNPRHYLTSYSGEWEGSMLPLHQRCLSMLIYARCNKSRLISQLDG